MSVCLCVTKYLANRWTDMVLLYSEAWLYADSGKVPYFFVFKLEKKYLASE